MEFKTRVVSDVSVIEIAGRFDMNTVPPITAWLDQVIASPPAQIVVDLADTTFVDSTALATLVHAMKRCRQGKGDLHLCGLRQPVYMIFELTRLDKAFNSEGRSRRGLRSPRILFFCSLWAASPPTTSRRAIVPTFPSLRSLERVS